LKISERTSLRKIWGLSYVSEVWRIKYDELYKLLKEPNIVQLLKIKYCSGWDILEGWMKVHTARN
jgi:hypothetical protein